jgi:ribosomal protein S18 acetylase RimI-like enzyme
MQVHISKGEDRDGIVRLYREFNDDRIASGVGDAQYRYIEGEIPWENTLGDEECFTFVARERNLILGFITLRIPEFNPFHKVGKLAEVDLTVVEKKLRRRGIGNLLFTTAQNELRALGVTHILLNVKVGNVPAMVFWSKMGFKKVSRTDYKRADGADESTIYMMKKI